MNMSEKVGKLGRGQWVWLMVAGRGSSVQSRGRRSKVAVAGPMSRLRVQSRGRDNPECSI